MNNLQEAKKVALEMLAQAQETGVSSFEFEYEGLSVKGNYTGSFTGAKAPISFPVEAASVVKETPVAVTAEPAQPANMETIAANVTSVKAPLVGTFYAAPAPDAAPYVSVGQKVQKGDVLCIVEAMKNMNEIESPCDGTIVDICASNGDLVEYNQILIQIG